MLTGIELRPVSLNKRQQNEEALFQKHSRRAHVSPMFPTFPCGKHCFQCLFLFPRYKLCLRYIAGNFNGSPSMRAAAKILRARASEHLSNFCEQFEQKPKFASTFKLDETIRYHYICIYAGREQSMKIVDRKISRSIDDNRLIIVN